MYKEILFRMSGFDLPAITQRKIAISSVAYRFEYSTTQMCFHNYDIFISFKPRKISCAKIHHRVLYHIVYIICKKTLP